MPSPFKTRPVKDAVTAPPAAPARSLRHVAIPLAVLFLAAFAGTAHAQATASLTDVISGLPYRTILLMIHVMGLSVGMGSALFLDAYMLRHLYDRPLTAHSVVLVEFGGKIVALGLAALWISGLGFLSLYFSESPEKLANPKIWSKVTIVAILTINGFVIHHFIFQRLLDRLGRPVLDKQSVADALPFIFAAAVSSVSWISAFCLGMMRELNNVVAWQHILSAYAALLAAGIVTGIAGHVVLTRSGLALQFSRNRRL